MRNSVIHHKRKSDANFFGGVLICILFAGLLQLTVVTTKALHSCGDSIICFQVCNFSAYKIPIWMSIAAVVAGIIFASIRIIAHLYKAQKFLNQLSIMDSLPICFSINFPTNRIHVFQNDTICWAFSAGVFLPKIYLSTGLIQLMTVEEIQAVLRHEVYHCRQFDTLRNLIINFLSDSMFFLPVFRNLKRNFQISSEKAADRFAILCGSSPLELSKALIKLFRVRNQVQKTIFVAINQGDLTDRIETLISNNETEKESKFTFSLAFSFALAISIFAGNPFGEEWPIPNEKECEMQVCNLNYQPCYEKGNDH